jgi:calcineurin-like phosphoesterase family protein
MSVFFTADTHFGDHRTINISRRPFANTAEMDAAMVERWNAVVGPDDVVWHLGDVARRPTDVAELLARLNGSKHLLRGNNVRMRRWRRTDGRASATMRKSSWMADSSSCVIIRSEAGTGSTAAR